jgi:hypothetical protein
LDDDLDPGQIMMASGVNASDIHPITVIAMPGADKVIEATIWLFDQCCTGAGVISSEFAKVLNLPANLTSPRTFNMANGQLKANQEIALTNTKLPVLSKRREICSRKSHDDPQNCSHT